MTSEFREEPTFGGPSDGSLDRNRARIRSRFNIFADLGEEFQAGFSIASGDVNDPTTTNQTMGVFYTRKAFALDQAYVNYDPSWFKPLTLTAGKFRYPWYNTELTWDKDLNPEGAAQTLAFNLENTPVLKRIAVVGFELPFAEEAGTGVTNKNIVQSMTYGAQLQTTWAIAPHLQLSAYTGYYDFQNADTIAQALAKASAKNPPTPWAGSLPLSTGNTSQNSITTTSSANIVTINGKAFPTGVTNIVNAQFNSKFGLFDTLARLDWDTGNARFPVTVIGDYVQNTRACANVGNIKQMPTNTATLVFTQTTNFPCNANQRRGYWLEARVGACQQRRLAGRLRPHLRRTRGCDQQLQLQRDASGNQRHRAPLRHLLHVPEKHTGRLHGVDWEAPWSQCSWPDRTLANAAAIRHDLRVLRLGPGVSGDIKAMFVHVGRSIFR